MNSDEMSQMIISVRGIRKHVDDAFRCLNDLDVYYFSESGEQDDLAEETLAFERYELHVDQAYRSLGVALEAFGLTDMLRRFTAEWPGNGNIRASITPIYEFDTLESKHFRVVSDTYESLLALSGGDLTDNAGKKHENRKREMIRLLEERLRLIPHYLEELGVQPTSEPEVHAPVRAWLSTEYTEDFEDKPKIARPIKAFEPDFGFYDLQVAIELKYVDSKEEVKRALGGVFEDVSGYRPGHYKTFITVIYQTKAFTNDKRFQAELNRSGIADWRAIVVTGSGARTKKKEEKQALETGLKGPKPTG